jgi:aminopeptidase-like protein
MKTAIEQYFDRLWPLNRSLTGNGNRETLKILSELVDFQITEVPSRTQCFDWTVPDEWNVKEAWIKDSKGKKIVDFARNNLHILGCSEPFQGKLSFQELSGHLFTLPDQPDLIPWLTSYYQRRWGFCLSHDQFERLDKNSMYEVLINSTLDEKGSMTMGEAILKGRSDKEILFSTYFCHPSMANNELSGPLVCSFLYSQLKQRKNLKYTYRFVFIPETIGSIYLLSRLGKHFRQKLDAGFVVTCIGDAGKFTYKKSRKGNTLADRVAETVLKQSEGEYTLKDFSPMGSDERQYCSPGFDLPVGSIMRTMHGEYPEYHTSADNKDFISFEAMEQSVFKLLDIIDVIENNEYLINTMPNCEPQLGKRGLYPTIGSNKDTRSIVSSMMWILNLSDGTSDLINISERSGISIKELIPVINKLKENGLIKI